MSTVAFPNLEATLAEMANEVPELYREQLAKGDKNTTERTLSDSVTAQVIQSGRVYMVQMSLAYYWKFVEWGTQGVVTSPIGAKCRAHFPPVRAILHWVQVKPVIPRPDNLGRVPGDRSLAFLIARKIFRHGIAPFPAMQATKEMLIEHWTARLNEAFAEDLKGMIQAELKIF